MTDLYLDGVKFAGERGAAGDSVKFGIQQNGIEGWYDTPSVKEDPESREGADGSFLRTQVHYSSRVVKATLMTLADSRYDHVALWKQLGELNRTPRRVRLVDLDDTFIDAVLEFTYPSGRLTGVAKITVIATADDPVRYATALQSLSLVSGARSGGTDYPTKYPTDYGGDADASQSYGVLTNDGNIASAPVITVRGSLPQGFTLMDSEGRGITYYDAVFPGSPVTVDCKNRRVMVNGVNRSVMLSRREWFTVPAKGSLGVSFIPATDATAGTSTATVQFRSAYI